MPAFLAIDAGTGSGRAVIFTMPAETRSPPSRTSGGTPAIRGGRDRWTSTPPATGRSCPLLRQAIGEADIAPGDIAAVSATCMREAIRALRWDGREIWACANVDSRAGEEVRLA